jgi:hypothetical protein
MRILVRLEGVDSSDIRVRKNCMDVDMGLQIRTLLEGDVHCLKMEYDGKDENILLL